MEANRMRCYRCKRHGKLVTMVKYNNGTARCPKCGITIHYEPRKRHKDESEGNTTVSLICFAISAILFGCAALKLNLQKIGLIAWAIGGALLALLFFLGHKGWL